MSAEKQTKKVTTVLPTALSDEAESIVVETGIGLSDLLRQGLIRVVNERRKEGQINLEVYKPRLVQPAAA